MQACVHLVLSHFRLGTKQILYSSVVVAIDSCSQSGALQMNVFYITDAEAMLISC